MKAQRAFKEMESPVHEQAEVLLELRERAAVLREDLKALKAQIVEVTEDLLGMMLREKVEVCRVGRVRLTCKSKAVLEIGLEKEEKLDSPDFRS